MHISFRIRDSPVSANIDFVLNFGKVMASSGNRMTELFYHANVFRMPLAPYRILKP